MAEPLPSTLPGVPGETACLCVPCQHLISLMADTEALREETRRSSQRATRNLEDAVRTLEETNSCADTTVSLG